MKSKETAEAFLETLRNSYFGKTSGPSHDFLRGECRLLSYLKYYKKKSITSGELADALGLTTARIASILKSLEKKGYITRECSEEDKRKVYVIITGSGIKYIEKKNDTVFRFYRDIFAQMEERDRDEFIRLLKIITDIAELTEMNA